MVKLKMVSSGKHAKRIERPDGTIVGQALELANGRWAPFDTRERRLVEVGISFAKPNDVLKFFRAAEASE